MYIIIECIDGELHTPRIVHIESEANRIFDSICGDNDGIQEYTDIDLQNESMGTVRLAGDDVYSVQMWEI